MGDNLGAKNGAGGNGKRDFNPLLGESSTSGLFALAPDAAVDDAADALAGLSEPPGQMEEEDNGPSIPEVSQKAINKGLRCIVTRYPLPHNRNHVANPIILCENKQCDKFLHFVCFQTKFKDEGLFPLIAGKQAAVCTRKCYNKVVAEEKKKEVTIT